MIRNSSGKIYVGISKNPRSRVSNHNKKGGAKFTKYRPDFKIVFLEDYSKLADARKREIQIKKWCRDKKEKLIERFQKGLRTKMSLET